MNNNGRFDANIRAPAAAWFAGNNPIRLEVAAGLEPPSPEEVIQAQDVEIRRLSSEMYRLHVTAGTIANAAIALTHMLLESQDRKGTEVRIQRDLRNRLDGAQIKVRTEPEGDIFVSYSDATKPIWEGRADG